MPLMVGADFHHEQFDAVALAGEKRARGLRLSVCLPARDEEATVGAIVAAIHADLVEGCGLVDEVVVVDDGSIDDTAGEASAAGARVERSSSVLPQFGPSRGKGDALWRSLHVAGGDLICWLDADLTDFASHFVTGLVGPLLTDPETATGGAGAPPRGGGGETPPGQRLAFVKAHYERPAGGRVTELMARPVLSALFPKLAPIVQPLGGEYAGRRAVLERLPFPVGWGVEVGLLVEVVERFGARAVAQVDLGVRHHRTRSIDELSPQALAILGTALELAGLREAKESEDLLRPRADGRVERVAVETGWRPPIIEVAEYRAQRRTIEESA
ncbi:MAG: glycosyltransferase [Actinobacteria bacterium]|nr:glycosyltransferase [Actinomycetota bacterium]